MTREQLLTEVLKGLEDMGFSEKVATLDPYPTETLIVCVSKDGIKVKTEWLPQVKPLTVVAETYREWLEKQKAKSKKPPTDKEQQYVKFTDFERILRNHAKKLDKILDFLQYQILACFVLVVLIALFI